MKKPELNNTYEFLNNENTLYEVKENATLTIIDIFTENIEVKRELKVNKNATLNYIKIGKSKENTTINYINDIEQNGILNIFLFDFSSSTCSIETKLQNSDASFKINGLLDLANNSKIEYEIKTDHLAKSFSDIKFKNLLLDKSTARLNMFSKVETSASFSKAFQNSQTILLSDDSSISVTPHLEILIDELEASHGATSGDLDKDSIYYLESRGIKEEDAKIMLLNALRNEVYAQLEDENLIKYIKGLI